MKMALARPARRALLALFVTSIFGLLQHGRPVEATTKTPSKAPSRAPTKGPSRAPSRAPTTTAVAPAGPFRTYQVEGVVPSRGTPANGTVVRAVAATDEGGAFVVGDFRAPSVRLGTVTLTNSKAPGADLFVARMQPDGAVAWAFAWGGEDDDFGRSVAWDPVQGKVYVLGDFQSSRLAVSDAGGRWVGLEKANGADLDVLVARVDGATGQVEWMTRLGDETGDDAGTALVLDPQRRGLVHVAGWFDFYDEVAGMTHQDTFVSVLEAGTGKEVLERGEFWAGDGDDVLTAGALSPTDGLLYVAGVSNSAQLALGLGGILFMDGIQSDPTKFDGSPRAFLVAIDTRRREVAWFLPLGQVAPSALSREPDIVQAALPLNGVTGVAVDPTNSNAIYVSGAFASPQVLKMIRAMYPANNAPPSASLLLIDAGTKAIVWAGVAPNIVTAGAWALAMDSFGFPYAANDREVVKFDRIRTDAPATVVARATLSSCGAGASDLAVDVRGSAFVGCIGGSVTRALVVSASP
jgi:hypothetical protein